MSGGSTYRRLLLLYPRPLREVYGEEMAQVYLELRRRHGRRIWARLLLDLAVSVPRTRLESLMATDLSTRAVTGIVVAAAVPLALVSVFVFGPIALPVPVLLIALVLAQRTRLARSMGVTRPTGALRAPVGGLVAGAVVLAGLVASWLHHVRTYEHLSETSVLVHNLGGAVALLVTLVSAGLVVVRLRRRPPGAFG